MYVVAFFAGVLAILSPCVLPVAPILLVSAWQQHVLGPLGLVAGLSTTFTLVGVLLASTGTILGFGADLFRGILEWMLLIAGIFLISQKLQDWLLWMASPLTNRLQNITHAAVLEGIAGQFLLGLILGGAWLPCTGPTLGFATSLASQGSHVGEAAGIMLVYSLGVSTPLISISYLSRGVIQHKGRWMKAGKIGKQILGWSLIVVGVFMIMNWDRSLESFLTQHMPSWLLKITTKY
jgi:cytochrome c biogenesis protein CcdA